MSKSEFNADAEVVVQLFGAMNCESHSTGERFSQIACGNVGGPPQNRIMPQFVLRPCNSRPTSDFFAELDFLFPSAAADKYFSSNLKRGLHFFVGVPCVLRSPSRTENIKMKTFCFGDKSIVCSTAVMQTALCKCETRPGAAFGVVG